MALYTKSELEKKSITDLKSLIKTHDIEIERGWKKPDLVNALLEVDESELTDEDELEDELEEELEEEEDIDLDEEDDELPEEDEEEARLDAIKAELDEEYEADLPEEDDIEEPAKPAAKKKSTSKPKVEKSGDTLAAKQVATILSENLKTAVDAKTLRQFFRSSASTVEAVGSGGRYEFAIEDVPTIEKEFKAWKEGHASRGTKRSGGRGKASASQVIEEVEEIEEIEELDEISDEDLAEEFDEDELELEEED